MLDIVENEEAAQQTENLNVTAADSRHLQLLGATFLHSSRRACLWMEQSEIKAKQEHGCLKQKKTAVSFKAMLLSAEDKFITRGQFTKYWGKNCNY